MEKRCLGCGALLQNTDSSKIGYVQDIKMDYCKRCFQMIHYDIHNDNDFVTDNNLVLEKLRTLTGQYVWIIDIFDLDSSLDSVLAQFFTEINCHIILNKCDLLPEKVNYQKIGQYVLKRIKDKKINCSAIITRGTNPDFLDNFYHYVSTDDNLIICGLANVGKSTIINQLIGKDVLTTNRYPGTTIEINQINTDFSIVNDTVGLVCPYSIQQYLTPKQLKAVLPSNKVRVTVFQLKQNQTISISGLCKIDIKNNQDATVILYLSNQIKLHRCKYENSEKLWQNNYGKLLSLTVNKCSGLKQMKTYKFSHNGKKDYFISGLGFITVISKKADVEISIYDKIMVKQREAMI